MNREHEDRGGADREVHKSPGPHRQRQNRDRQRRSEQKEGGTGEGSARGS